MNTLKSYLILPVLICLALALNIGNVKANGTQQGIEIASPVSQADPSMPVDYADMESFMDNLISSHLDEYDIAGATVIVVKDGQPFFTKGYGYADVANYIPVNSDKTIFRIGSISKLFTSTAAMQLVERGLLDLDQDVNIYLKSFQIPATFDKPITIKNLLTHTTGFEYRISRLFAVDADALIPNGEWLKTNLPVRVEPPGEYIAYSNYGMMLLGYIVEQVSGISYEQYLEENIFQPLGMNHTTARQPLPPELVPFLSKGYNEGSGMAQEFEWTQVVPAGGLSSSAPDMANFMLAHLNGGCLGEACILGEAATLQMQETLFTHDPRVNGFAYGFIEVSRNGQRIIGHGGDTILFHSLLALFPEHNLGVFVSYNSAAGTILVHDRFLSAFTDHYFPVSDEISQPLSKASEQAMQAAGYYRSMDKAYTTSEKLIGLFNVIKMQWDGEAIRISTAAGPQRFFEVEPGFFRTQDGSDAMVIWSSDENNRIYAYINSSLVYSLEKVNWYNSPVFNSALLVASVLLCLSMIIAMPVRMIRARRQDQTQAAQPYLARITRWIGFITAVLGIVTSAGITILGFNSFPILFGTFSWSFPLTILTLSTTALTAGAVIFTGLAWKDGYWSMIERGHYTLFTIAIIGLVWFMYFWNVLIICL